MEEIRVFPRGTDSARVIQVIETEAIRGGGANSANGQPARRVKQYWTLDGEFLAENDPAALVVMEER